MQTDMPSAKKPLATYTSRILALGLLAAVLLVTLTGCKTGSLAAGQNPTGVYALISVDGKSLPCSMRHEGAILTIKSGTFIINADGTCRSLINFLVRPDKDLNHEVKAIYTQSGNELTMHWEGAGTTKGRLKGKEFTMNNEGMDLVYRNSRK